MIEVLVGKVFITRNFAHQEHLRTKSYAQHMALGSFYEDIISNLDGLIEAYQGKFGLISIPPLPTVNPPKNIVGYLRAEAEWIEKNRSKIAKDTPYIENLVDGLTEKYYTTIYKLTNLS